MKFKAFLRYLFCAILAFVVIVSFRQSVPGEAATTNPISPPSTDSPRETITHFIKNMDTAYTLVMTAYSQGKDEPGWRYSKRLNAMSHKAEDALERAIETFDFSDVPPASRTDVSLETVLMMKEIFDRIEIPSSKDIPDLAKMEELGETQWSIPDTRITLTQIAEGDAKGAFLFSKDTVGKVSNFYRELVSYPYKPSATTQGFYNFYITSPGGILPPKWAHFIPKWSDKVFFDQTIWQWFSSILIYGSTVIFLISVQKSLRSKSLNDNRLVSAWLALLLPSTILIFISLTDYIVDNIINLTGDVLQLIKWIDVVLNFLAGSWLAFVFVNAIGTTLAASKGFRDKPLTLIMLRNGFRLLGLVVGAIVLAIGCSTMGISLAPLLASLGAGSLALSFGLRPYIQDIIGGITLFANGAMKIGDYCEFNGVAGTVEDIGIRATLIRTTDRKLITVPNSGVSDTLVNYSRRDKYVFERILEISADTPRAQLPDLMDGLRQQLEDHPLVEDARVSLIGLNKAKIQIELFGYVLTTSSSDYMDIQSELLIFVADELAKQGIEGSLRV